MSDDLRPPRSLDDGRGIAFAPSSSTTPVEWLLLVLITCLAGIVRTLQLAARGFTIDEGFSAYLALTSAANFKGLVWHSELNMALYYAVLRLWVVLGHSEFVVRMLSVLFATATVPVVYFLGKRLFNARTGLMAALLLAFHPFHFILAQDARSYSLAILLVCLASLFFLRGLQNATWINWLAYALYATAAVYSHFFAILIIAAHAASLLFLRRSMVPWKRLLLAASPHGDPAVARCSLPAASSRRRKRRLGSAPQPRSGEVCVLFADAVEVPFADLRGSMGAWPLGTPCVTALLKVHGRSGSRSVGF